MDKKVDNSKSIKILISVVVVALIGIIAFFLGKDEGYRLIQVYQVNGEATIERENVGSMEAYENLNLLSGDKVTTMAESNLRLKLDEDKFLFAEADTIMELVATGDAKSSRTNINLLQGAVTIEVQNKLEESASFEVTTPNAVMAVRGTVFRINTDVDEEGNPITKVMIFEGVVGVQKVNENGEISEETLIPESKEAIIYIENEEEVLVILDEIDVSELPVEVLEFLKEIIEGGRELSISLEDIDLAIEDANKEVFTVSFTYNGSVFGTQEVKEGELATKPTLMPAPSGSWDFDFSTPITADTEIRFIE